MAEPSGATLGRVPVLAIGVSHHQASADQLIRFTACGQQVLDELRVLPGVHGVIELATCNRYELYIDTDQFHSTKRQANRLLIEAGAGELIELIDPLAARNAVEHLLRVASGLESMVVGEPEIVGQVRQALTASPGRISPALRRLFQLALSTSKQIAASTTLGSVGRNLATVALDLAEARHGSLVDTEVLLLGTGSYAGAVTAELAQRGAQVLVHSGSGRAQAFARSHEVTAITAPQLPAVIGAVSAVISCSGLGGHTLTVEQLVAVSAGRSCQLTIIDLALGRDIDPLLADVPGVDLIDLDEIGRHAPAQHTETLAAANRVVQAAVEGYLEAERERLADPAVRAMRDHVNAIIDNEIESVAARATPEVSAAVARSLRRVAGVLLHTPSLRAAELARGGDPDEVNRAIETVFGVKVDA